jgi:hypothetical protein
MAQPASATAVQLFAKLAIPFISRWVRSAPHAIDDRVLHRSGPDPVRLLLIGDGNAVGYGVLSHELGFGGAIAGRVAGLTSRGVELEVVSDGRMTAHDVRGELDRVDLSKFDGVILNVGLSDALRMTSSVVWRSGMRAVLDALEVAGVATFAVEVPIASDDGAAPSSVRNWIRREAARFNDILVEEVGRTPGAAYVPLRSLEGRRFNGRATREYYEEIAAQVAPIVAAGVVTASRPPSRQEESARLRSLRATRILDSEPEARFDRIVTAVRQSFAVEMAAITFIDRDRQWMKAAVGTEREDTDRDVAICSTTIQGEGLLVIEDAREDERFADYPGVAAVDGVRFYAGYPLETKEGYRVGALCIMDPRPHSFSTHDGVVLRDFALEAQRQLWAS